MKALAQNFSMSDCTSLNTMTNSSIVSVMPLQKWGDAVDILTWYRPKTVLKFTSNASLKEVMATLFSRVIGFYIRVAPGSVAL